MMEPRTRNFLGQSGFIWTFGIVEDRLDPSGENRLRVRCFGIHTPDKTLLPTEDLPWSTPMMSLNSSDDPVDVVEGDLVFGFFLDALEMQELVVIGVLQSKNGGALSLLSGFTDPRTDLNSFPRKPKTFTDGGFEDGVASNNSLGDSKHQLNDYAKGGSTVASLAKSAQRVTSIKLPGGTTMSEPTSPYAPKYPFNKAKETESGHVFEMDDTPGQERVHIFHRSGSYIEIHPDGKVVKKSLKDSYEITLGDTIRYSKGKEKVSSAGYEQLSSAEYNLEISKGDLNIDVKSGSVNMIVNGDVNHKCTGNYNVTAAGNIVMRAATILLN